MMCALLKKTQWPNFNLLLSSSSSRDRFWIGYNLSLVLNRYSSSSLLRASLMYIPNHIVELWPTNAAEDDPQPFIEGRELEHIGGIDRVQRMPRSPRVERGNSCWLVYINYVVGKSLLLLGRRLFCLVSCVTVLLFGPCMERVVCRKSGWMGTEIRLWGNSQPASHQLWCGHPLQCFLAPLPPLLR